MSAPASGRPPGVAHDFRNPPRPSPSRHESQAGLSHVAHDSEDNEECGNTATMTRHSQVRTWNIDQFIGGLQDAASAFVVEKEVEEEDGEQKEEEDEQEEEAGTSPRRQSTQTTTTAQKVPLPPLRRPLNVKPPPLPTIVLPATQQVQASTPPVPLTLTGQPRKATNVKVGTRVGDCPGYPADAVPEPGLSLYLVCQRYPQSI